MIHNLGKKMADPGIIDEFVRRMNLNLNNQDDSKKDCIIRCKYQNGTLSMQITIRDNLNRLFIEVGWWKDTWEIIQKAFLDYSDVTTVQIIGYFPIVDVYGKTQNKKIAYICLPITEFFKINRDVFLPNNLPKIGEGFFHWPDE